MQTAQALNAVDLAGHTRQHGGLIAAACTNLQHAAHHGCALQTRRFAQQRNHAGHHVGFGDGLTQANRQTGVFVGLVHQSAVNKTMALHTPHGFKHHRIVNALRCQLLHHAGTNGR